MRNKPLLWIGSLIGLLLLVIATLAIYIGTRSDEWWRDQLIAALSQTLEREVVIQGEFRLELGRDITVEAESLRIYNPEWSKSRDMLRLGSLKLEFDLLSVLGDTLLVNRLELADIELALEENLEGQRNWEFPVETKPPATRKPAEGITLPVHIEHLSLQRTQLSISQPRWERPLVLVVEKITGGRSPDDKAIIKGNGRVGDLQFSLKGSLGTITSALNRGPVSYQLSGKLGEARLQSEGSIDSLTAPLRPQLDLILNGPDILQITQAMGAPKIAEGPFEAQLNIMPGGRGVNSRIQGRFGQLQLHADISAEDLATTENMDVTARLSGENLAAFADLLRLPPLPKGTFEIDTVLQNDNSVTRIEKMMASVGKHRISAEGVIGAWPELKDTRLELQANGPDLAAFTPTIAVMGLGQLPAGAYTVNALLEPGENGLQVRPSKVTAGDYLATVEGRILTKNQFRTELNVTGSGPDLSMITRLVDTIQLPAWPFQARGKIVITAKDITLIGASGTAGKHQVAVAGPIAFSSSGPLRLDVKGNGPSLQAVLQGLGYDVIPASAAYQIDGTVEIINNRLVVTAKHARLGPAEASTTLSIPDLNIPTTLMVDVRELKTTDTATALALAGMQLDLLQVMPANLSGKITRTKNTTKLSNIRGTIGATSINVDGAIGDPPDYGNTRVNLDISGPDLEHFLDHPVEQAIPFHIKGSVARDKSDTRFENLQLKVANLEANMHGRLGSWENLEGSELNTSVQGPNLDAIAAILNRPLPVGAVKFDGHVRGTEDAFHIDRMNAQLGRSNLSGDLKLTRGKPPRLKGKVSSTYLDLALFQKKVEPEPSSNAKTSDTVNADAKEDEEDAPKQPIRLLFPDTPVDLEPFNKLGLDLEIQIDELANMMKLGSLYDLKVAVLLKAGKLSMKDFEVRGVRDGKVEGNMVIGYDAEITRMDVEMTGKQIRMGLAAAPGQKPETFPPADVEAKFTAAGSTYRKLANSLNGRIKVVQGEGLVSNSRAGILLSDVFYELFQSLNPFAKTEPTTRLNCGVYIANLAGGKAELQTIVIQTDKLTILSAGTVDLNTERIDIDFETRPRKGVGISASTITNAYIKLGGSLSKPAVGLNPERAAVATGAAVATAGLSFLYKGIWDRYFSSRDPCGDALKRDAELQANKAKQQ
jgi:uncharacterized protein involved in outer membrane biogenesis